MLAGRTGLCPVMVGRGMELARLQRALAADETQVVLVSGEAGVGKTRLLRELSATLPVGARVLAGQASQGVPARPFQLLLEAIGPSVSTWRQVPQRLADREEPLRLLLRPILGHLEPFTDREYSQEELLGAAVALVEDLLIGTGRGVLVFEDLHWADAQSVALFGRLALTPRLGALLVGSFRPEAVDRRHQLVATLADVGRQREITQVALDRLDQHAVAELLAAVYGHPVPFRVAEAMHRRTGGNPFFLEELLVAGGVVLEDEPDVFRFRHALTREAIAGELLGRERRRLHEKALAGLHEAGSTDWAAIAWHARGARRYEDLVSAARVGAASYLQRGASLEALRLAEEGLSEAGDDPELEMLASKAAWLVGLIDIAIEHGERWHTIARQVGRPEDEVGALIHLARLYDEAVEWSDRALELSEEIGFRPARVTALVNKGSALIEQPGRRQDGVELLERSIAEAEAAGYDLLLFRALHNLLWGTLGEWPPERSRQMLRTLRDLSERKGRGGALGRLDLLAMEIATVEGDLAEAGAALEEHTAAERDADPYVTSTESLLRLELAARLGDRDGVRALLDGLRAGAVAQAWCSPHLGMDSLTGGLLAAIRAGLEPAVARGFLAEAERAVAELSQPAADEIRAGERPLAPARRHLEAALLEAEGNHSAALDAYLEAGGTEGQRTVPLRADCQLGAARCQVALGRSEEAKAHARAAEELLARWPGWRRDEARALLVRLRAVPRRGAGPLTPREREVAQLVAEGLSNGEVAKRLFISTKTASVHVSNILGKLGMSSRAEIAAWAVGTGLAMVGQGQR